MSALNPFGGPSEVKPSAGIVEYSGDVDAWRKRYLAHEALNKDDTGILWNGRVASIYPQAFLSSARYNSLMGLSELRQSKVMDKAIDELDFKGDDTVKTRQRERLKAFCAKNALGLNTGHDKVDQALKSLQDTMNGQKPWTSKWGPKSMGYFGAQRMEEEIFRTARGELVARQVQEKKAFEELLTREFLYKYTFDNKADYDAAVKTRTVSAAWPVIDEGGGKVSCNGCFISKDKASYEKAKLDKLVPGDWIPISDSTGTIICMAPDAKLNQEGQELKEAFENMQANEMLNCDKAESKARTMFQDNIEYNKDWAIICAMQSTDSFNQAKEKQKKRCEDIIATHEAEMKKKGGMLMALGLNLSPEVLEAYEIRDGLSDALPSIEDFDELQVTLDNHVQGSWSCVMKVSKDNDGGLHLAFEHDSTKGSIENRKDVYEAVDRIILTVLCTQRKKGISVAEAKIKLDGGSDEMIRVLAAAAIARGYRPENITLTKNGQKADMPEDIKKRAQSVRRESLVNTGTMDEVSNRMDYAVQSPALMPALDKAETAEEVDELHAKYTVEYDRVEEALKAIANANIADDKAFSQAVLELNKLSYDPSYTRLKDNWGRWAIANTLTGGVAYGLASTLGVLDTNPFVLLHTSRKEGAKDAIYKPLTAIALPAKEKTAIQEAAKQSFAQLQTKRVALEQQFNTKKTALSSTGKMI